MAERNRMARDIHDTLAQGFTGVIVQLEAAEEALSQGQSTKISEHLDRAGELARGSLHEARRSVQALRPQALEAKMLGEALRDLIGQMTAGTAMQVQFVVQGKPWELPSAWESDLLRIGQEALTNALRHARASEFRVQMVFGTADMRLDLRDNGAGFDPAKRHEGLGLQGMRERVEGMGGQWSIQSTINGGGTLVSVFLPRPPAAVAEPPAP
jgi:signal transduction histidine kinase